MGNSMSSSILRREAAQRGEKAPEFTASRPRCPECDEMIHDLDDHDWGSREDIVASCGSCGKDFVLSRRVSVSYSAARLTP